MANKVVLALIIGFLTWVSAFWLLARSEYAKKLLDRSDASSDQQIHLVFVLPVSLAITVVIIVLYLIDRLPL